MAIGPQLVAARTAAGLTLADVNTATHIRVDVLAGIDGDDFSRCRGNSYARGHVRAYARAVGVDPEPLLQEFNASHAAPDNPMGRPVLPVPEREPARSSSRLLVLSTALVALVLVLAWVVGGRSPAPASPLQMGPPTANAPAVAALAPGAVHQGAANVADPRPRRAVVA